MSEQVPGKAYEFLAGLHRDFVSSRDERDRLLLEFAANGYGEGCGGGKGG